MEIVFGLACILFVVMIGYHCMKESDARGVFKREQADRLHEIQAERARQTAAAYERQRVTRSAPITTGSPVAPRASTGSTTKVEVKRHDNSFDNVVDSYSAPAYSSSHSSGSSSSHSSCSSSSSSSSSSDSSSSSSSCD